MMKLKFTGDVAGLEGGIAILGRELGFTVSEDGLPVNVSRAPGNILVSMDGKSGFIKFGEKIQFFRALGRLAEEFRSRKSFSIEEEPMFDLNGPMVDVSRNAVLKVESVKRMIRIMAVMGLNMLMLYSEDTYTVDAHPYFGYMRGRYTQDELKECDDYADIFGIEIIPCIQTLAHLTEALKWSNYKDIRDIEDILLAGSEKTYRFIEDMIKSVSSPLRSKRIHVGMDEAHFLGLGRYLDINGYQRRFDIMNGHLARVVEIASKYGLRPMIWSDMFFRLGSKTGEYYDYEGVIPDDVIEKVPKEVQLVYWDYYHGEESDYHEFIRRHKKFGSAPVFAGGVWTWSGICVNYPKTFLTTNAGLTACKKEGVREVFATMWGDNGAETNVFSALLGMQLFAEHGYAREPDMEKMKSRFEFCTGGNYDAFMKLGSLDMPAGITGYDYDEVGNPSKYLLWQDVLIGLFDRHVQGLPLPEYYRRASQALSKFGTKAGEWDFIFKMPQQLCSVLSVKSDIGIRIKECYDRKDLGSLEEIAMVILPELSRRVDELRVVHREQWLRTYKPFGWEVLDIRYGGLLARIETAIARLTDYVDGRVSIIEELEEERLFFDGRTQAGNVPLCRHNQYFRIATASPL